MGRVTRLQALPIGPDAAQVSIYTIAPGLSNPPNPQLGPTPTTAVYILSCEPFESTYCTENEKSEWIFFCDSPTARPQSTNLGLVPAIGRSQKAVRFSPASGCVTMLIPRLLTQHTSEAMHVQGNDRQSNRSGESLSTFRPNTVESTVFKIVDG